MASRIAVVMVHTSPLEQTGIGDAGGMNIYVAESAKRIAESGIKVDIFTRKLSDTDKEWVDFAPGVRICNLNIPISTKKEEIPNLIPAISSELGQLLGKEKYDLIHSHYWISGKVAMAAAKEFQIPLVHTMHTMARVKNLSLAEGETPEPMVRVQGESQIVEFAQGLIANTDAEAASLVSLYDACPDRVRVVAPGVDLQSFTPDREGARARIGIKESEQVITFVGRIQPHKGPEVLIRAMAELVTHNPNLRSNLKVIIAGGASGAKSDEVIRLKDRSSP